ncbi:MAG: hypothetical protein ACLFUQ_01235 [Candidatus Izemoplasmataceae bacterium]
MIKIASIDSKGNTYQVTFEDNGETTTITVHQDVLMRHGLLKKKTLTEKERLEIEKENASAMLMQKALDLLAHRDHSSESMRRKLEKEGRHEAVMETIDTLKTLGYLDDERMLRRLVDDMIEYSLKGPRAIREKALKEGFEPSAIDSALASFDESLEEDRLIRFIKKEQERYPKDPIKKKKMKLTKRAIQNGYAMDLASATVERLLDADKDASNEEQLLERRIEALRDSYDLNDYKSTRKLIQKLMREGFDYEAIKDRLK